MSKKKFTAENIRDAIARVKEELGPDAVILSTRKVPKKAGDPYSKDMVEVEATLESPVESLREPSFSLSPSKTSSHEKSVNGNEAMTAQKAMDILDDVRCDLAQIKDMISFSTAGPKMAHLLADRMENMGLLASFLRAGVSEPLACSIISQAEKQLSREDGLEELPKEDQLRKLKKNAMALCLNKIRTRDIVDMKSGGPLPRIAAFVGPTGVGKTTTIAKLAALLSFTRDLRVGLISVDTYRIGAFEQLKAYAGIMGLFCIQAFTPQDVKDALSRMKSMDVVLIDTAGHSHYDREKLGKMLEMLQADESISVHLTLSVPSELTNMKEAAMVFSSLNPETYVFTKIDESRNCGKIFDQIDFLDLPVSLITNGQKVPEDLMVPDRQKLLKTILNKDGFGGEK